MVLLVYKKSKMNAINPYGLMEILLQFATKKVALKANKIATNR